MMATALNNLGGMLAEMGDWEKAEETLFCALALRQELGERSELGATLHNLGALRSAQGDSGGAIAYYHQSLQSFGVAG